MLEKQKKEFYKEMETGDCFGLQYLYSFIQPQDTDLFNVIVKLNCNIDERDSNTHDLYLELLNELLIRYQL